MRLLEELLMQQLQVPWGFGPSVLTAHSGSLGLIEPRPLYTASILKQTAAGLVQCYNLMDPVYFY